MMTKKHYLVDLQNSIKTTDIRSFQINGDRHIIIIMKIKGPLFKHATCVEMES